MIYEKILKPILFRFTDPEKIHHTVLEGMRVVSRQKTLYNYFYNICNIKDPRLKTKIGSVEFENPVGLAAGFEKYIRAPLAYPMLGFGFAELGSITYSAQPGNPKPRLWRIPEDQGLIVYYGLSNDGAVKTSEYLSELPVHPIPYGLSIAPTTGLELKEMADDYIKTLLQLHPFADYITFNVSCPNVARCEAFAQVTFIEELVQKVARVASEQNIKKDFFIKIGPHHSATDLIRIANICIASGFTGIVATNLIKIRSGIETKTPTEKMSHPGGISGKLLQAQSDSVIRELYKYCGDKLKIIGVGGIFTAEDAYRKIKLGASAVQVITGFIYGGPLTIKNINRGLSRLLANDGHKNIADAVGIDA